MNFVNFLKKLYHISEKLGLNILPHIIWDMILAESAVASDIAKHIKDPNFDNIQFDSKVKRIHIGVVQK